jgi:hypothetical protein
MDASWYNRALDQRLSDEGLVDAQLLGEFLNAFNDSASSHGWIVAKLQLLRRRISRGGRVTVQDRASKIELASAQDFEAWVRRNFTGLEH